MDSVSSVRYAAVGSVLLRTRAGGRWSATAWIGGWTTTAQLQLAAGEWNIGLICCRRKNERPIGVGHALTCALCSILSRITASLTQLLGSPNFWRISSLRLAHLLRVPWYWCQHCSRFSSKRCVTSYIDELNKYDSLACRSAGENKVNVPDRTEE